MALALDTSLNANNFPTTGTTYSTSYTCTGANRVLLVWLLEDGGIAVSGVTYNGVAMTKQGSFSNANSGGNASLWYLFAPATGSNTLLVTYASARYTNIVILSYTGAKQSAFPDNIGTTQGTTTTTISTTLTPVATGAWGLMFISTARDISNGTNFTLRGSAVSSNAQAGDTNGIISGSTTMTATQSSASGAFGLMVTIAPVAAANSSSFFLAASMM